MCPLNELKQDKNLEDLSSPRRQNLGIIPKGTIRGSAIRGTNHRFLLEGNLTLQWKYPPYRVIIIGCRIVFGIFVCLRFWIFVGFLSRHHLPCICNSLELEPVILHGICYILAWSLCILHGIC